MPTYTGRAKTLIDCTDLDGLRGIAAVWIMMFHILVYSNPLIDLQGSTLMPLFFLLSGFTLTIGYSGRLLQDSEENTQKLLEDFHPSQSKGSSVSLNKFYYNRFLRILPVYYLCFVFAVPLTYNGYGTFDARENLGFTIGSYIQNIFPTTTWTAFAIGAPFDGPEWTISTLIFFWLFFPWILQHYEKKSDEELLNCIYRNFWLQIWTGIIFFLVGFFSGAVDPFWLSTAWPISRLPVFNMGICAGLLCNRHVNSNDDSFPWFTHSQYFIPGEFFIFQSYTTLSPNVTNKTIDFANVAIYQSLGLLILTLLWTILNAGGIYIVANIWFGFLNVFAQLSVIVALVRCKGETIISKFLRHPFVQWLGELSMALYMVHWPCIFYACWLVKGSSISWPSTLDCSDKYDHDDALENSCQDEVDQFNQDRTLQYWFIPIIPIVSIGLASFLYYFIEEPVRLRFK